MATAVSSGSVSLTWAPSTDTGSGVDVYLVSVRLVGNDAITLRNASTNSLTIDVLPARTYEFSVVARDRAGNTSFSSPSLSVTTPAVDAGDTVPPTTPGTPTVSAVTSTGATLTWAPSTDNVGVTGYRIYRVHLVDVLVDTVTAPTHTLTGLSPQTGYQFYVVAIDAAGNASPPSGAVTVTTSAPLPTSPCRVTYGTNDWSTGFTANITITNTGTTAINGWTLAFSFPNAGQRVGQGWSATYAQTGAAVTATNMSYNGNLAPGASVGIGFNGTHTGSNPKPTTFTLNGATCTIG